MTVEETNEIEKKNLDNNEIEHEMEEEPSMNEDLLKFWKNFCESGDKCNNTTCGFNGVFAPVCTNGVCIVPRPDNSMDIVKGYGLIRALNSNNCKKNEYVVFRLSIKKEFGLYNGELIITNYDSRQTIYSKDLVFYHSDDNLKFIAIFHIESQEGEVRELAVYGSVKHPPNHHKPNPVKYPSLYYYSAPYIKEKEISMGGEIIKGNLEIMSNSEENHHMNM